MTDKPRDYDILAEVFTRWWRDLQSYDPKTGRSILINGQTKPPNRKALAELRRIGVVDAGGAAVIDVARAYSVPEFMALLWSLRQTHGFGNGLQRWLNPAPDRFTVEPFAIAAATLARVRDDGTTDKTGRGATAHLLGEPRTEGGDARLYAEVRFKRLLRCRDDWPDLLNQARRVAAILEREAPVGDLGASLVLWNLEPAIRRDWAFQYYQRAYEATGDKAPPAATPVTP